MKVIEDTISTILAQWNKDIIETGRTDIFILDVKCREKVFYINRIDTYKQNIAEMSFYVKGDPTLLLWRKELRMPSKVKGMTKVQVEEDYIRGLYEHFLYECIAAFSMTTRQLIITKDYAEYDIEKDRLKAHESGDGMIVSVTEDGPFYVKGNEFDVFMATDNAYFVYSAHDSCRPNNGIGKLDKGIVLVKELAKTRILLPDKDF